jgi:predicted nucleic acid-binding protein
VIYLLDVNALLALGIREHEFHARTAKWVKRAAAGETAFATCAITELGFLRVLLQASYAGATIAQGQKLLELLKSSGQLRFQFLVDDQDASHLPHWVKWPKQITDGHLVALAKAHDALLATLDERLRGAFVIPR